MGSLNPILGSSGHKPGYTLNGVATHCRPYAYTFTHLIIQAINLHCRGKPAYVEESHQAQRQHAKFTENTRTISEIQTPNSVGARQPW